MIGGMRSVLGERGPTRAQEAFLLEKIIEALTLAASTGTDVTLTGAEAKLVLSDVLAVQLALAYAKRVEAPCPRCGAKPGAAP